MTQIEVGKFSFVILYFYKTLIILQPYQVCVASKNSS